MASWKAQEQGSGSVVKAVQIVEVAEEGGLILKKNALEEILAQLPSADMHVAVLSICGEFRTGKSFFLNYLLHCLSNKLPATGSELETMCGFSWRSGLDACTKGVWAWPNMFIIEKTGSQPFGLLLIDTEGTEDAKQKFKDSALVFALTTLISSFQIINIQKQIRANDLACLQIFTDIASRNQQGAYSCNPFQDLMMLVRDTTGEPPFGIASNSFMSRYGLISHEKKKERSPNPEINDVGKCYRRIRGFLMPHPGNRVGLLQGSSPDGQQWNQRGENEYTPDERVFFENLNELIEVVLTSIEIKAFNENEPLHSRLIITLMESFISKENENSEIKSHTEALAEVIKSNALIRATEEYAGKIQGKWKELDAPDTSRKYFIEMKAFHCKLKEELVNRFSDRKGCGGLLINDSERLKLKEELQEKIENVFRDQCELIKACVAKQNYTTLAGAFATYSRNMRQHCGKECVSMRLLNEEHSRSLKMSETYLSECFQPTEISRVEEEYVRQDLNKLSEELKKKIDEYFNSCCFMVKGNASKLIDEEIKIALHNLDQWINSCTDSGVLGQLFFGEMANIKQRLKTRLLRAGIEQHEIDFRSLEQLGAKYRDDRSKLLEAQGRQRIAEEKAKRELEAREETEDRMREQHEAFEERMREQHEAFQEQVRKARKAAKKAEKEAEEQTRKAHKAEKEAEKESEANEKTMEKKKKMQEETKETAREASAAKERAESAIKEPAALQTVAAMALVTVAPTNPILGATIAAGALAIEGATRATIDDSNKE